MKRLTSGLARAAVILLLLATPASAQLVQDFSYGCYDPVFMLVSPVAAWGTAVCKPPSPYDLFNVPAGGWGATPACTTGGSFACNPGDTYIQTPASPGVGTVLSSNFLLLTNGTLTNVPGLSIGAFLVPTTISAARTAVVVTTDGGVQVNSTVPTQYDGVDIFLFRDVVGGASVQLLQRRVHAANQPITGPVNQAISPWSFTYTDRPPTGGIYSYRVAAQLVFNNGTAAIVAGAAATVPWLRGTLSATQIIQ